MPCARANSAASSSVLPEMIDLRAVTPGVLDLHHRRADRHHDGSGNAEPMCVIGHALRMIAGRHRDHAALPFVRRQRQQPVERAALLEGRGELQVLEFEPEIAAADLAQRPALVAFGDDDRAGNGSGRGSDVIGRDGKACFGSVLVRRGVLGGFRHFGGLVGRQSYKPFPLDPPPPNLVKSRPMNMGVAKSRRGVKLGRGPQGQAAGVFR